MLQTSVYLVGLSVFNGIHLPCIIKNTQAAHCVDIQSVEMDTQLGFQCRVNPNSGMQIYISIISLDSAAHGTLPLKAIDWLIYNPYNLVH